jgi:3-deoxy-D-manno-octulosonic-acid transferase
VAFIGGSLVAHGGQNLLEAARFDCAIVHGPHMFNFAEAVAGMRAAGAAWEVNDDEQLAHAVAALWADPARRDDYAARAAEYLAQQQGVTMRVLERLAPLIERGMHDARA